MAKYKHSLEQRLKWRYAKRIQRARGQEEQEEIRWERDSAVRALEESREKKRARDRRYRERKIERLGAERVREIERNRSRKRRARERAKREEEERKRQQDLTEEEGPGAIDPGEIPYGWKLLPLHTPIKSPVLPKVLAFENVWAYYDDTKLPEAGARIGQVVIYDSRGRDLGGTIQLGREAVMDAMRELSGDFSVKLIGVLFPETKAVKFSVQYKQRGKRR